MHQTYTYSGSNAVKEAAALNDCTFYLGKKIFRNVVRALRNDLDDHTRTRTQQLRTAHLILSFVGIRGRWPVRAMVRQAYKGLS